MIVSSEYVDIPAGRSPMRMFVASPHAGEKYPGILCYSDIFQLTGPMLRACTRLAGYGFVIAAPEIYHRIEPPGSAIPFDDAGRTRGLEGAAKTPVAHFDEDRRAALDYLARHPRVSPGKLGAMGFCIGGHLAFRAALEPDVLATVCFYGTGIHNGKLGQDADSGSLARAREMPIKGRQKNVIVTPEGLNVYPQDLEAELRKEPGVRDCVVVGLARDGNAEACGVLLLREAQPETDAAEIVRRANQRLAPFQQMRRWLVWPDKDFPRTPTQKPMLGRIREAAEAEFGSGKAADTRVAAATGPLAELFARVSHGRSLPGDASTLELSSVERVELLSALEDRYQVDLSETEFATADTVRELERLVELPASHAAPFRYPRWAQRWPARAFRFAVLNLLARPAMLILAWPRIRGRENLRETDGPVLVVANHETYLDPAYVLEALPGRLRRRLAVAMDGERLTAMRNPSADTGFFAGLLGRVKYVLITAIFHVFPLPRLSGFRKSFAFAGDLIDRGWSVLVFPEGELTRDGRIAPFRAGIGLLAARLKVPVVPMRIEGLYERREADKSWAPPGHVRVSIGAPVRFSETDATEEIALELERRVAALPDQERRGSHR